MTAHDERVTAAKSSARTIFATLACLGFLALVTPTTAEAARPSVTEDAQAVTISDVAAATGRVLLGQIFVISGVRKIPNFTATAARMTSYGLPMAETLLIPTIGLEIGGGLMLAANLYPDWAAGALSLFVIPTTFIFHNFWSVPTAVEAAREQIQFMKNLAILGGLMTVFSQSVGQD